MPVFLPYKQHTQCGDFWQMSFAFSPPKMWDPGKNTAGCLFCGESQQSSFRRLKTNWKNTSWVIFPLPILTGSMSGCTVPKFTGSSWRELLRPLHQRHFSRNYIERVLAPNYKFTACHCSSGLPSGLTSSEDPIQGNIFLEASNLALSGHL